MKIYVAHSTGFDFRNELYAPLKETTGSHTFIFPHEDDSFKHSKDTIANCDLVLAEVSHPSTGLGIELGWADSAGVPIVCIHEAETRPSTSLGAVSETFITYSSPVTIAESVSSYLKSTRVSA